MGVVEGQLGAEMTGVEELVTLTTVVRPHRPPAGPTDPDRTGAQGFELDQIKGGHQCPGGRESRAISAAETTTAGVYATAAPLK